MPNSSLNLPNLITYTPEEGSLSNKFIIITGATDGIGKALALSCVQLGAELLLIGKDDKKLNALTKQLQQNSDTEHYSYLIDFSIAGEADYIKFAEHLASQNKPIDSLILNAGYMEALQGLRNYQLELWLRTITVNQHAPFMLAKCCIPLLEASQDPSIIFSTHDCNKAYWGAYGVAKSAQLGMMKILANELDGDKRIRVNGVDPSPVSTKLRLTNFPGIDPENFSAPEEVIAPYLYFIGADSKGVTGANYKLNPNFAG
ncbi:MAG: SDR family NAD(P)-dependent oxidoreductase [Gammaproteobacteria bacterium]